MALAFWCMSLSFLCPMQKVVGASTLLTELPGPASRALDQFQRLACGLLMGAEETTEHGAALDFRGRSGGYLVEGGDGLVLAAFGSPRAAVEWALDTVEALRELVSAGWCCRA